MYKNVCTVLIGTLIYISTTEAAEAQIPRDVLVKKVAVINELGRGIKAEIRILDVSDRDTHFGYTDDAGIARPNQKCDRRNRLSAKPSITLYRVLGNYPYCDAEVTIVMQLPRIALALTENADRALSDGKYGIATMLYTEAAVRLADIDPKASEKIELRAYESAIKKLGLGNNAIYFDPQQEKYVLSRSGVRGVIAFQRRNDIPATGLLDSATLRTMAGRPIFPFIKEAYIDSKDKE